MLRLTLALATLAIVLPACGGDGEQRAAEAPAAVETAPTSGATRTYEVWLVAIGTRKIEVIKQVRSLTALGLREAKDLVESAPKRVKGGLPRADADAALKALEAAGATAEVR